MLFKVVYVILDMNDVIMEGSEHEPEEISVGYILRILDGSYLLSVR